MNVKHTCAHAHAHTHTEPSYLNGQMQKHTALHKLEQNKLKIKQAWGKKVPGTLQNVLSSKNATTLSWSPLEGDKYLWSLVFRWGRGQVVNEHLPRHRSGLGTLEKAALLSLHSLSFLTSKSLLRPRRKGTASGRDTSGINFISKKTWLSIFGKKTLKAIDFLSLLF